LINLLKKINVELNIEIEEYFFNYEYFKKSKCITCNQSDNLTFNKNDIMLNVKCIFFKHISVQEPICADFISNLFVKECLICCSNSKHI